MTEGNSVSKTINKSCNTSVGTTQNPLGTAPVGRLLRQFALPSIVAMLVGALYNIVDQIFIGQSIGALKFWQSTGGTIVAIRRGQTVILSPGPYAELYDGDVLVLVGSPAAVEAAHNLIAPKEVTNDPI